MVAVEIWQGTLDVAAQLEAKEEEAKEKDKEKEKEKINTKSNNPHLTGGEKVARIAATLQLMREVSAQNLED